jgi:hypothetical protein
MRKERKHFTPEEKVAILRRHLVDGAGSEVGRGEGTAEESPPAGGVMDETDCSRLADNAELTPAARPSIYSTKRIAAFP